MIEFTVFTATYNRAHTISRVYESLVRQTFKRFEWVIVDDGSTDGTAELVQNWQANSEFPIRYFRQKNAGKHLAVNYGVSEARGVFFVNIDSDNACVPEALERLRFHWMAIPSDEQEGFVGVSALIQRADGTLLGTPFPEEPTDSNTLELRFKHGVRGDKWGFQRTEIMRRFPYPEIGGEKRVPDSLVWNRIAKKYKTRFVNETLGVRYETPGSRSSNIDLARISSPHATYVYYSELLDSGFLKPADALKYYINSARFARHAGIPLENELANAPSKAWWFATLVFGRIMYFRDLYRQHKFSTKKSSLLRKVSVSRGR
jgi:glycosyltransferase involved in cell wall biosynthesis